MKLKNLTIPIYILLALATWSFNACNQQGQQDTKYGVGDMVITRTSDYSVSIDYTEVEDTAITDAIEEEIFIQKGVDNTDIEITTIDGIVTMNGTARSILEKDRAADIAKSIKGVRGVINNLNVREGKYSDQDLLVLIRQELVRNDALESFDINPVITDGEVILNGSVQSWQEKRIAENVVKNVSGVKAINNNIIVANKEFRPDNEIEEDIESIMDWDIRVDDELIDVNVENGVVYLSGSVGSVAEKTQAKNLALMSNVKDVNHDELEVVRWARDTDMRQSKYTYRSDENIKEAINDILLFDTRVNSFDIGVIVEDGTVTLTGIVPSMRAKEVARQDAINIVGVWNVRNLIEIQSPELLADSMVENSVVASFATDPYLENYELAVEVTDGKLLLTGLVDNSFEKNRAEQVASYIEGITDIENDISVEKGNFLPFVYDYSFQTYYSQDEVRTEFENIKTDDEILNDTQEQIFWSPFVNEEEVTVAVEDGIVTLTGTVQTPRERTLAEKNAYEAGAITVNNELLVAYGPNPVN